MYLNAKEESKKTKEESTDVQKNTESGAWHKSLMR
jgi:hypothetical protein